MYVYVYATQLVVAYCIRGKIGQICTCTCTTIIKSAIQSMHCVYKAIHTSTSVATSTEGFCPVLVLSCFCGYVSFSPKYSYAVDYDFNCVCTHRPVHGGKTYIELENIHE